MQRKGSKTSLAFGRGGELVLSTEHKNTTIRMTLPAARYANPHPLPSLRLTSCHCMCSTSTDDKSSCAHMTKWSTWDDDNRRAGTRVGSGEGMTGLDKHSAFLWRALHRSCCMHTMARQTLLHAAGAQRAPCDARKGRKKRPVPYAAFIPRMTHANTAPGPSPPPPAAVPSPAPRPHPGLSCPSHPPEPRTPSRSLQHGTGSGRV